MTELTAVRDADGAWRFAALVASAIPVKPPADWFDAPDLDGPTHLVVTADGRVYGHAASWGVRHIGLPGATTAPRSPSGYRYYRTGEVECDDGSMVATGRITLGTGHAGLDGVSLTAASEHYDHTGFAVADVACGEDEHGIWVAGALRPEVAPEQIRALRASDVSGDWRPIGRDLEMVGLLAVNVGGFPTPRAALAASGEITALVAAGVITREATPDSSAPQPPAPDPNTPEGLLHAMTENSDAVTAAAPAPGPPPPPPEEVPEPGTGGFASGDTVIFAELPFQVVDTTDDGDVVIEATVPADQVQPADQEQALAASARHDERQRERVRDARMRQQDELLRTTTEQLATVTASATALADRVAAMETERTAEQARALYADAGLDV